MANTPYSNFYLSNEVEDQFNSHLDLQPFCTVDNGLTGVAGLTRKIHRYRATNGTQKLAKGQGNNTVIGASYTDETYVIQLAQNHFQWQDEDAMEDPMIVPVGARHAGTDMFNTVNADIYDEFKKAVKVVPVSSFDFDGFADTVAMLDVETDEDVEIFAFINPTNKAALRKALKDDLKYVEAFSRNGYIGTVCGVNIYAKKDATVNLITVGTRKAVTIFNKKGVEVEIPPRSSSEANTRTNDMFTRKYYIVALTDANYAVKLLIGTAALSTDTTVDPDATYYEQSGTGYIEVTPVGTENPTTEGWYEIA